MLSRMRQQRASERPLSASNLQCGTSKSNRHRISKSSKSTGTSDDGSSSSHCSSQKISLKSVAESKNRKQHRIKDKDRSPVVAPNIGKERRNSTGQSKQRSSHKRRDSRSSESLGRELRSLGEKKKLSSAVSRLDGERESNNLSPSLHSSADSVGTGKSKKASSSLSKTEDQADELSYRSVKRRGRRGRSSNRSVGSSKNSPSRSSSRKYRSDREKGRRLSSSRSNRSPRSLKGAIGTPRSDESLRRREISVSEDEIMALLGLTYDGPLATGDDDVRSISPNPDERKTTYSKSSGPKDYTSRRSNSPHRAEVSKKILRRASNGDEYRNERRDRKPRVPPRKYGGLDDFLQCDISVNDRKKTSTGSRSVDLNVSGGKKGSRGSRSVVSGARSAVSSKSFTGSRSVATSRSSQNRRRRREIATGKALIPTGPDALKEDYLSDGMHDSILIAGNEHEEYDDHKNIDLDLAIARDNFARQHMSEKLQLHLNKTDELLYSVFPKHIANALRNGQKVEPENHDLVTIFFSDIVGFTDISAKLDPLKISEMLDRLYNSFDALSDYHDVFKVETIGDAYMAVTNLTTAQSDHCKRITEFAIDAIRVANQTLVDEENPSMGFVNIRVGFHSGSVVSNVVGTRNPRYCLFGDTVNTASRMESNSQKNRIHCSEISAKLLKKQCPRMRIYPRGRIDVKGKGEMETFWIHTEGSATAKDKKNGTIRNFMKSVRKK